MKKLPEESFIISGVLTLFGSALILSHWFPTDVGLCIGPGLFLGMLVAFITYKFQ